MINIFKFLGHLLFILGMATGIAVTIGVVSLILLSWIVDLLRLNYKGNTYWALNVCLCNFVVSWIVSFGYYISK